MYEAKENKQSICRKIINSDRLDTAISFKNKDEVSSKNFSSSNTMDVLLSFSNNDKNSKSGEKVLQKFAMANVVLAVDEEYNPYVANINFKERVPTNLHTVQGDHTVAETLIEASFKAFVPCSIHDFLLNLKRIMESHINPGTVAVHTSELDNSRLQIKAEDVHNEIFDLIENWGDIDRVFWSRVLSDVATKVWRLMNQRPYSAFKRSEGFTTGGGGEREALENLLGMPVPYSTWRSDDYIDKIVEVAIPLIDLTSNAPDDWIKTITRRAAEHIGDVLKIQDSGWKNRLGAKLYTKITGKTMKPQSAPVYGWDTF